MIRRCLGCLSRYIYIPGSAPTQEGPESRPMIPNPSIEWKDCKPFVPPLTSGYVVKVYDGDTITIASKLPYPESPLYRFAVRLNGIDAPEIKGKNEDEKRAAQIAKQALENLILHRTVVLKNPHQEKYGRILADVYIGELNLNKWMLDNKYVVPYDGGTKKSPDSWLEFHATTTSDVKGKKPHDH